MKLILLLGMLFCLVKHRTTVGVHLSWDEDSEIVYDFGAFEDSDEENKATLKSLVVTSDIKVRYARTVVSAEYYNDRNSAATADFHVILPDRAYISNFSMEMNGEVSVGEVKEKEIAKQIFEGALERGESAGHVAVRHRFTKRFDMTVNVEPNVKVVFNLTYEELLKRTHGNYSHKIFLSNGKVIDRILVEVFISEPQDIKVMDENIDENLSVRSVDYIDNTHVYIKFDPSREEQEKLIEAGFNGEFTVEYDVDRTKSNVLYTLDGYFVHFFAPDDEPIWPKNIVFMIDVSGSMEGEKLRQVKKAMHSILSTLNPHKDSFIFGTFSDSVSWQHSQSLQEAEKFIESLTADGGTDINQAMLASLDKLTGNPRFNTADILFFLTDGDPTSGVFDKDDIRLNVQNANTRDVLIFMLGFGEDCDLKFLQNIAKDNNGFSRKIYIDDDSDQQIKDMFNEISSILLKNVIITYVNSRIEVENLTKNEFKTIFKGSEIAIAGPIEKGKEKLRTITAVIQAENADVIIIRTEKFDVEIDEIITLEDIPKNPNLTRLGQLQDITKKTWAYLTLKKMFEENAPSEDIVALAIEYGFVTPLTSMVVTKKHLRGEVSQEGKDEVTPRPVDPITPKPVVPSTRRPVDPIRTRPTRHPHYVPIIDSQASITDPPSRGGRPLDIDQSAGKNYLSSIDQSAGKNYLLSIDHSAMINHHVDIDPPSRGDYDLPQWVQEILAAARTTTTTPAPTTATRPPTTTTRPPTTTTIVPHLPKLPAIVVKPYKCDLMLCVSQHKKCINGSKVLLLKDLRADVEIYGESQNTSSVTCMENLYKITIKSRRKTTVITPTLVTINKKSFDPTNRKLIRLSLKKFFRLDVFFNRNGKQATISLKFIVQDHIKRAHGLYGQYMKEFDCKIQPTGEVNLSHMNRKFKKVTFTSPEVGFDHCYM